MRRWLEPDWYRSLLYRAGRSGRWFDPNWYRYLRYREGRSGRWFDPNWYRYLRYRAGWSGLVGPLVAFGLLATGGALAMRALAGGNSTASYVPLTTTAVRRVRVIEHGRTVYKRVLQETRTIDAPGGTRIVTHQAVRYQPVYRRQVVTVDGKPVTVARLVTDMRVLTDTQSLTVTNEHTSTVLNDHTVVDRQTVNQTVTNDRTETLPAETVTVTGPTHTVVLTTTVQSTVTITQPLVTITVTTPKP